ncbi:MAG: helix-turn-helix transcriptional regulator [Oscillospiraceae bacterium]|nr:helix-turn-helix transcriptional regulator [Oscillospiraceae bacterium]
MEKNTLGSRVRQLRRSKGFTQIQLADNLYISESYIALIEADKRNPSIDIVSKLADFFCVTTDYLINGKKSDTERLLLKEWEKIISGRSEKEIKSALSLVKSFFDCLDDE